MKRKGERKRRGEYRVSRNNGVNDICIYPFATWCEGRRVAVTDKRIDGQTAMLREITLHAQNDHETVTSVLPFSHFPSLSFCFMFTIPFTIPSGHQDPDVFLSAHLQTPVSYLFPSYSASMADHYLVFASGRLTVMFPENTDER